MSTKITRRTFVKACAIASTAAAAGVSLAGCVESTDGGSGSEEAEDGVIKMKTCCHGCIQVCPAIAYVKDGVVVKVEGDPDAPQNQGALCIKGLNQLHTMYSPRRILHPIKRAGERGENKWEVISWDEALDLAATNIKDITEKYGPYAFFTSTGGGGGYSWNEVTTFRDVIGAPTTFEPGCAQCYLPRVATAGYMYAGRDHSIADNAVQEPFNNWKNETEMHVIWAAQPSTSQTAQSGHSIADLRAKGCKTVVVDPNYSPDAVKADVWLPIRPGTDTKLVLCWWRYILENKLYDDEFAKYWTNIPFLIDPDTKLPVKAEELFPDYENPAIDPNDEFDTPAYVCYDLKTNSVQPFPFSAPKDSPVDPEIIWEGEYEGKTYKTAGQIYWEEADPWTLEKTAEDCWLKADKIEEAIRLYADAKVAGFSNGVAIDMTESASQVPLGLMGLDAIMGYVNKPGSTLTQKGPETVPTERPTKKYTFSNGNGIGYTVGKTENWNKKFIDDVLADPEQGPKMEMFGQFLKDRLGMVDHKGLYDWDMSHIPTVLNAIKTGEPFKPRCWYDVSGNKLAMLGNATSWYEAFPEIDYIMGQYPMLTSFHIEACDLVFPLREWLEQPMGGPGFGGRNQLNTSWLQNQCTHIGETVSNSVPPAQIIKRFEEIGGKPSGLIYTPIGSDTELKASIAEGFGAADWDDLQANTDKYVPFVTPPEEYWQYNQHETIVSDGLPAGFGTESRKFEVYCTLLLKMARTGFPYLYPYEQEPCEDYSPICKAIEPAESPVEGYDGYDPEYPYVLTSGRLPYFHHGTMRHAPFSRELFPTAEIRMNPATAAEIGVGQLDWVKVTSRRGSVCARAWLTEAIHPKTVWMERFWNPECYDSSQSSISGGWQEENVNVLTKNTAPFNEVFGSYTNRGFTVKLEKGERPDRVWVEPEEFAPFLPTEEMLAEPQTEDVF